MMDLAQKLPTPAQQAASHGSRLVRRLAALLLPALLLTGCSTIPFVYERLDGFALREAERWMDLDGEQAARLQQRLDERLLRHRLHELPRYAEVLEHGGELIARGGSPGEFQQLLEQLEALAWEALQASVPALAQTFAELDQEQVEHFARELEESNAEFREEYLDPPPERRRADRIEAFEDGIERWTGRLDAEQRALLGRLVDASPDDAREWYERRLRWQQGVLALLRDGAPASAHAAWLEQWWQPGNGKDPDDARREREASAAGLAELAASLAPAQRARAQERLRSVASELRGLHREEPALAARP